MNTNWRYSCPLLLFSTPSASFATPLLQMHISCIEGDTFLAGLFERHWQWTASIADDRLQFYTQHHLSGRSGGEVLARVCRMCMLDAQERFPDKKINFTTSEKPRETHSLPWRPLEKAAKKAVRDNAVGLLTEAFKGLELKRK